MFSFITVLAGIVSAAAAPQPIHLEAVPNAGGVEVQVIGRSDVAAAARYQLVVTSGSSGNRSTQSGVARLQPGQTAVLVRLRMSSGDQGQWSVRLSVEPESGEPYVREVTSSSAEAAG